MNERIVELAEQADIHFHKGGTLDAGPNGIARFVLYSDMEKFAELIVRECAKACEDVANADGTGPWFEGYVSGVEEVNRRMKQHFGVEE